QREVTEADLDAQITRVATTPFDLSAGEVIRAELLRLAPGRAVLALSIHHIAADGWSLGVLTRDLSTLYAARQASHAPDLPALPIQYRDFALWQRRWLDGPARAQALSYWRDALRDLPQISLPQARRRPDPARHRGAGLRIEIPADTARRLIALSRKQAATLYMGLLAQYQAVLGHYAGQDDIVTGSPIAGRNQAETEGLIGFFVNMLTLRGDLSGAPDLPTLLTRMRQRTLDAYAHQDLPFEAIVEAIAPSRDSSQHPLFQVHFALQTAEVTPPRFGEITVRPIAAPIHWVRFDLECHLWHEEDGAIRGQWLYDTDLFAPEMIEAMAAHFIRLVTHWTAHPDQSMDAALRATAPAIPAPAIPALPAPAMPARPAPGTHPAPVSLSDRFAQIARTQPEATALLHRDQTLSYGDLDARATALAQTLIAQGLRPEAPIGLSAQPGFDLITGILGILRAGGRYIPLDPSYPPARISLMAQTAGLDLILTDGMAPLPDALDPLPRLTIAAAIASAHTTAAPLPKLQPDHAAYTLYTSGSTGTPKGVTITHANVTSLIDGCAPRFGFGPKDVWSLFHAYAFDFSVWEIWGPLLTGGRLVIVPPDTRRDPAALHDLLRATSVTVLNQTPTAFYGLIRADQDAAPLTALAHVIFGGEALDPARLAPWWARYGTECPRLTNMYGITETCVHVTEHILTPADRDAQDSPIGRPIP
ncbi:non-ribosomal peptide synthetase component F, partial [Rubricella aquisinus]